VLDLRQKSAPRDTVAFQFVGHTHTRHVLQALQQSLEKSVGGFAITPPLNQNVEDDAMLVDRPRK
jgi:hypothetical protein